MTVDSPQAGIALTTKHLALAFLLAFVKPRVHIDGSEPITLKWGRVVFPVYPGRHTVRCYAPYLFYRFMGDNSIVVDVAAGGVLELRWRAPWLVFLKGKFTVANPGAVAPQTSAPFGPVGPPTAPMPATPMPGAGWHRDPGGRHQLRYWDGAAWTSHVSDNGVTSTDAS